MPPPKVAKMLARIMGVSLIVLGLLAFVPNILIGSVGYFRTDLVLNAVFVLFGAVLLGSTTKGEGTAASGLYMVGMLAFALALVGYTQVAEYPSGVDVKLFDLAACNLEAVWLLGGMSATLVICGLMNTSSRQIVRD